MITVQILEDFDEVLPSDWCRPLSLHTMAGGHSDYYSFESGWSGQPENNVRWVNVDQIFGEDWFLKKVLEINGAMSRWGSGYEFIRGNIPKNHQYGLTNRQSKKLFEDYLATTICTLPRHKGKTWAEIERCDIGYFSWARDKDLVKKLEDFK